VHAGQVTEQLHVDDVPSMESCIDELDKELTQAVETSESSEPDSACMKQRKFIQAYIQACKTAIYSSMKKNITWSHTMTFEAAQSLCSL
jgi:hypothetical protein